MMIVMIPLMFPWPTNGHMSAVDGTNSTFKRLGSIDEFVFGCCPFLRCSWELQIFPKQCVLYGLCNLVDSPTH